MCPTAMWASWIRGVLREGICRAMSERDAAFPPSPVRAIVVIPSFFAARSALRTFAEEPLVVIPRATSPFFPRAFTCLLKISSNE
jgi:hypothetical protein